MAEGILERIFAELETMNGTLATLQGSMMSTGGGAAAPEEKAEVKKTTGGTGKKSKLSAADLTALVQPLVQAEDTKVKVKDILTSFGLKRLGDAKEEQFDALHAAFTEIANGGDGDSGDDDLL